MTKKILILEPSKTIQTLILEKTKKADFELIFESSFIQYFLSILSKKPDALFINADHENPQGFEFVRFIKSMAYFIFSIATIIC